MGRSCHRLAVLLPLIASAVVLGCATGKTKRQTTASFPATPVATALPDKSPVHFASYYQDAAAPEPEPVSPSDTKTPENIPATMPLDLASALGMVRGQNPRIAFAQAQISQAWAQYGAARVMWLPSIRAGMNYNKHEGRIQE